MRYLVVFEFLHYLPPRGAFPHRFLCHNTKTLTPFRAFIFLHLYSASLHCCRCHAFLTFYRLTRLYLPSVFLFSAHSTRYTVSLPAAYVAPRVFLFVSLEQFRLLFLVDYARALHCRCSDYYICVSYARSDVSHRLTFYWVLLIHHAFSFYVSPVFVAVSTFHAGAGYTTTPFSGCAYLAPFLPFWYYVFSCVFSPPRFCSYFPTCAIYDCISITTRYTILHSLFISSHIFHYLPCLHSILFFHRFVSTCILLRLCTAHTPLLTFLSFHIRSLPILPTFFYVNYTYVSRCYTVRCLIPISLLFLEFCLFLCPARYHYIPVCFCSLRKILLRGICYIRYSFTVLLFILVEGTTDTFSVLCCACRATLFIPVHWRRIPCNFITKFHCYSTLLLAFPSSCRHFTFSGPFLPPTRCRLHFLPYCPYIYILLLGDGR